MSLSASIAALDRAVDSALAERRIVGCVVLLAQGGRLVHARAAGLADRCEVQVSYAIGVAQPTSISVTTFGTGKVPDEKIEKLIRKHFDLRPFGIIKMLDLVHPMYQATAAYGHFGRDPYEVALANGEKFTAFSWEKTDRAAALRADAGLKK